MLALEQVYAEWVATENGLKGSYRLFLEITKSYEFFDAFEKGCHLEDLLVKVWDKTLAAEVEVEQDEIIDLVKYLLRFWYGIAWNSTEDIGVGVGRWIHIFYDLSIEDIRASEADWVCPSDRAIERNTYNDWTPMKW